MWGGGEIEKDGVPEWWGPGEGRRGGVGGGGLLIYHILKTMRATNLESDEINKY